MTAKGRAILDREKENHRSGARFGETHTAFTLKRKEPVKKLGLELNRFFGRGGNKTAAAADAAAARDEQHTSLLSEQHAPPPPGPALSRAEELKARLASKVEAVKAGESRQKSWLTGSSSQAAPAPSSAAPHAAAAPPERPASASAGDSLDNLFANLGRK